MTQEWNTRTKLVHDGIRRSQYGEMAEALFLTQGFVYPTAEAAEARFIASGDDEFIYARYGNPTTRMFEDRIASIEGTEDAFATASGMAAINGALTALVKMGDHIVAARQMFGSCLHVLKVLQGFGVEVTLVDGTQLDEWRAAMRPNTKVCFFESVSNPGLEVIDIAGVAEIAHAGGAVVVVDNVFSSPIFSRAVALGADVVAYSTTKHSRRRRPGAGRCRLRHARLHPRPAGNLCQAHRRRDEPVPCLDHAERHADAGSARARAGRQCRDDRQRRGRA